MSCRWGELDECHVSLVFSLPFSPSHQGSTERPKENRSEEKKWGIIIQQQWDVLSLAESCDATSVSDDSGSRLQLDQLWIGFNSWKDCWWSLYFVTNMFSDCQIEDLSWVLVSSPERTRSNEELSLCLTKHQAAVFALSPAYRHRNLFYSPVCSPFNTQTYKKLQ